ncbi:MAG: nucleotidyltransferase domain-containing protein [Clostridiales bacterium]|nr:nucleotidyltransferase domain-containing protein [Clostridiales bacterium]
MLRQVYVFGSYARGEATADSDVENNKGRYSCDDGNVQELGINRRIRT